jgi:hypothetical protein
MGGLRETSIVDWSRIILIWSVSLILSWRSERFLALSIGCQYRFVAFRNDRFLVDGVMIDGFSQRCERCLAGA